MRLLARASCLRRSARDKPSRGLVSDTERLRSAAGRLLLSTRQHQTQNQDLETKNSTDGMLGLTSGSVDRVPGLTGKLLRGSARVPFESALAEAAGGDLDRFAAGGRPPAAGVTAGELVASVGAAGAAFAAGAGLGRAVAAGVGCPSSPGSVSSATQRWTEYSMRLTAGRLTQSFLRLVRTAL